MIRVVADIAFKVLVLPFKLAFKPAVIPFLFLPALYGCVTYAAESAKTRRIDSAIESAVAGIHGKGRGCFENVSPTASFTITCDIRRKLITLQARDFTVCNGAVAWAKEEGRRHSVRPVCRPGSTSLVYILIS